MDEASISPEEEKRYAELQVMALDFARTGETENLVSMVEAGLPVNLSDHKGNTLLMLATYYGNADTAAMLLRHGAEVDRPNDRGQTPLGGVAFKGDLACARILLEAGANSNADNGGGATPLFFATLFGRREVAELLRQSGGGQGKRPILRILATCLGPIVGPTVRILRGFLRRSQRSEASTKPLATTDESLPGDGH